MKNQVKPRGTYSDYVNKNTEDKIFIFELVKSNKDNPQVVDGTTGAIVKFPLTASFPMVGTIYAKDKDGRSYPRKIRYVEGENSIYVDEQTPDDKKPKVMVRANFVGGRKQIEGRDKTQLDFFMAWDINQTKEDRDEKKQAKFFLVDTSKLVAKSRQADKEKFEAAQWCYDAPLDQVRAVASLKLNSEQMAQQAEDIRWNLKLIAERDPSEFLKMLKDPKTERRYILLKSIEKGVISIDSRTNGVYWSDNPNAPLTVASQGKDALEDFIAKSFSGDGERYYESIRQAVQPAKVVESAPKEVVTNFVPAPEKEVITVEKPSIQAPGESDGELSVLVKAGIAKGLITVDRIGWHKYKGKASMKEIGFIKALRDQPLMLDVLKSEVLG